LVPHFTIPQIQDIVRYRAVKAKNLGCAGVIIAGTEVKKLRKECPSPFVFVTPGIRETSLPTNAHDDQKRTMTAKQALEAGSDYLVVGRPICIASSPRDIALEIMEDVRYFGSHTAS
jgi:orotidine-5'-phosphate decarboxylase